MRREIEFGRHKQQGFAKFLAIDEYPAVIIDGFKMRERPLIYGKFRQQKGALQPVESGRPQRRGHLHAIHQHAVHAPFPGAVEAHSRARDDWLLLGRLGRLNRDRRRSQRSYKLAPVHATSALIANSSSGCSLRFRWISKLPTAPPRSGMENNKT